MVASRVAALVSSLVVLTLTLTLIGMSPSPANAQDRYVEFEPAQVKPITIARVNGHDYLLVCNTPDDSVEIYDTVGNRFLQRVPVGLAPVTVTWHAAASVFYTCNRIGDSVSAVRFTATGQADPEARLESTMYVGDDPTDLVVLPYVGWLFVTLGARCSVAILDPFSLLPIGGPSFGGRIPLTFPLFQGTAPVAMREPRRVLFHDDKLLFVSAKGGNSGVYDLDLLGIDLATARQEILGGLGTANMAVAGARDGRLFVAGGLALNHLQGEAANAAAPTGFVESRLWVVDGVLTNGVQVQSRDLNRTETGAIAPKAHAVSLPTDVVLKESGAGVDRVYLTSFQSDRIVALMPDGQPPAQWPLVTADLTPPASGGYSRHGPRGLALKEPAPGVANDPGWRLYVLCAHSASVKVFDPDTLQELPGFALQNDPTPAAVRAGRKFLYGAELSGTGFVSCASCHVDARSDGLAWNLGDTAGGSGDAINQVLVDGVIGGAGTQYPKNKGPLLTQPLLGLLKHPVQGDAKQLFSGGPLHWRGDMPTFLHFNRAYVTLQGMPNLGTAASPAGISTADMRAFEAFVHHLTFPPNPEQPLDGRLSGTFGDPQLEDGSGAQRGLKLYHTRRLPGGVVGGRSCVQCHSLPDGSNGRLTSQSSAGPLKTTGFRASRTREARLELDAASLSTVKINHFGLLHDGRGPGSGSLNWFMVETFGAVFQNEVEKLTDMVRLLREWPATTPPLLGHAFSVRSFQRQLLGVGGLFGLFEATAARAEVGVAVHVRNGSAMRGYWLDVTASPPLYRLEGGTAALTREQLLDLLVDWSDVLVVQATPIGSERRMASTSGTPAVLNGPPPTQLSLLPMAVPAVWAGVPSLTKNWRRGSTVDDFLWDPIGTPEPAFPAALRVMQQALATKAPAFGVPGMRHDAPRRLRVAGKDVRPGAVLVLGIANDPLRKPPYATTQGILEVRLPLFATSERTPGGLPIWETAAEMEPIAYYPLLLGGRAAPDVQQAVYGQVAEPPPATAFDPLGWNLYQVTVENEDAAKTTAPAWQPLVLE